MVPPPYNPLVGRICYERRLHNDAWFASYQYLKHEHEQRKWRIYNKITRHNKRPFAAMALPYTSGEGLYDVESFKNEGYLGPGTTAVYYSDGSERNVEQHLDGFLSSAIAYSDSHGWHTESYSLPRYSGGTHDAELYALKMAFDAAVRHSVEPMCTFQNVVIFVDRKDIICMLAGEDDVIHEIGPAPFNGDWALAGIYAGAEKLKSAGITVVVAWIKAHRGGAGRAGNKAADKAAERALNNSILHTLYQAPASRLPFWVDSLEGDAREETLWRLSKPFFRWGTGNCWIAPTLSHGNDIRAIEEEEKEDWTVYPSGMTLKEAQEEDARELRHDLLEKHRVEKPFIPLKPIAVRKPMSKAPPLRHVYRQTRVLPKRPKAFNYAKLYKEVRENQGKARIATLGAYQMSDIC